MVEVEFEPIWKQIEEELKATDAADAEDDGKSDEELKDGVPQDRRAPRAPGPAAVGDRPAEQYPGSE